MRSRRSWSRGGDSLIGARGARPRAGHTPRPPSPSVQSCSSRARDERPSCVLLLVAGLAYPNGHAMYI